MCIVLSIFGIADLDCKIFRYLDVLYAIAAVLGSLSLLYFVTINRHSRHLLAIFQKMCFDVIIFIIIGAIFFFAVVNSFYILFYEQDNCMLLS